MKTYLSFALRELKAQKMTAILILIAIILSTIMTTALGQSLGILQSMRKEQAANLNGNRYATFHQLAEGQMQKLTEDERLLDVGSLITLGDVSLENSGLTLFLREYLENALDAYPSIGQIKEGRLPTSPFEIALPEDSLKYLSEDLQIGDQITLNPQISLLTDDQPPYQYSATFTLCGILESSYLGYATGSITGVIGEGTAKQLLPERYLLYSTDFKTKSTKQFQSTVSDLASEITVPEESIQYNWILLDAIGISYDEKGLSDTDTGFSFMVIACVVVGALVLLAAGLVIYNVLKIAVAKRIRSYGTLRAIGGERVQLYRLVAVQLLFLCGIGIPIGLLCGTASAKWILVAATGLLNPTLFMARNSGELAASIGATNAGNAILLLVSGGISLIFAVLAAFPAARYAAHVSPTVAMAGQTTAIRRKNRRVKKIRNFEAYYARVNLNRNRGRTIITILSLVMSITVFVALQSFSTILDTSQPVKDMYLGDYSVTSEIVGMDENAVEGIRAHEAIAQVATTKLSVYQQAEDGTIPISLGFKLQSWETFQLAGIDDVRLSSYVEGLTKQDLQDLLTGKACLIKSAIPFSYEGNTVEGTNFKVGDIITVSGKEVRIAGIAATPVSINNSGFVNGVQMIMTNKLYDELAGQSRYSEVYPMLKENSDSGAFESWLDEWCEQNSGSHWLSYRNVEEELAESFAQIKFLCWGLILFIGLIGILNIINTVYSNIHTRISEIGTQRAIGMSKKNLYQTFLWEGAYYGIIASLVGTVMGYLCTVFVHAATTDTLQLVAVPYLSILQAVVFSIFACLIATALPLHSISKMNIVESIETIQ